ncbi:hypothetical protein [Paenibacillus sp. FSL R7-0179]|uniref:hypothetical protein n=1 Tax=Paenibacillus sp. FSL R7-0179 TaxID=2921672 RepID=UPI0030F56EA0
MRGAVLVLAKRMPVGRIGGQLCTLEPEQLLAPLIQRLIHEARLPPEWIDDGAGCTCRRDTPQMSGYESEG